MFNKEIIKETLNSIKRIDIITGNYYHSNLKAMKYLKSVLNNLIIKIPYQGYSDIFELMSKGKLQRWCHYTSQSAILLFDDNDYIEKGYLYLNKNQPNYYHSWVTFNYGNQEYVFDPCLNCICKRKEYHEIFKIKETKTIRAKDIKRFLIEKINYYKSKTMINHDKFNKYKESVANKVYEIKIDDRDIFNEHFSGMNVIYNLELNNKKINKVEANYNL